MKNDSVNLDHHGHIVHFYENETELAESVTSFVAAALLKNEGILLIATQPHKKVFELSLAQAGFETPQLIKSKQIVFLDAAETLEKFVVDGIPDPEKFRSVIVPIFKEMRNFFTKINAYGEMVGVLWDAGNTDATILLEQLWNDLAKEESFSLLCGYGHSQFKEADHRPHFQKICAEHTHVIPSGQSGDEGFSGAHYRVIAELQQREKALQNEIAERKRIGAQLIKQQAELNDFFDNSVVGLHLVGPDGTILRANKAELELLGFEESEYVGRNIVEFHVDDEVISEILNRLSCRETLRDFPARLKCKDGSIKDVLIDSNVSFENGQFKFTRCFTRDVTHKKIAEEQLRESQQRYRALFDFSPLPKWIFSLETLRFVDVNNAALELYGHTKDEFLSLKATDICPAEDVPLFLEALKEDSGESKTSVTRRFRHKKKDGSIIEAEVSALNIILDGQKHRSGAVVDITDRVAWEKKQADLLDSLKAAKEEAEHANQLKSAFLANMSHEIRTPLGAMVGFADLLRDPSLSPEEHANYISILTRNGEQLSTIINDILDLSKVEAGHLTLECQASSPDAIAADVLSLLRVKANEKDLVLEYKSELSTPAKVVTDSLRVRQIVMNVVGNAIKFTQAGSVKVRSFGAEDPELGRMLYFEVSDTGIGIPELEKERIFEAFVQADRTLVRRFGGTGLGLPLSRELARSLGGDICVTKTIEGKGSTFLISIQDRPEKCTLQSERVENRVHFEPAPDILNGLNILVVDDSPDNRQLIWHFLSKYGAAVDFAEDGLLGYRKALAGNFDVILMDIQMPEMDGYTATQKLRDAGYRNPIIALTAHAMTEVRKKCLLVGCSDHLPKPIKPKELVSVVAKFGRGMST